MEIEIATIGGYEDVGRQMTAVRAGEDSVVFDMGLNLSQVLIHDDVETERLHSLDLIDMGTISSHQDMECSVPDVELAGDLGSELGRDRHVTRNGDARTLVEA